MRIQDLTLGPATGVPRAANREKEATLTKQANDFRIFAGRYFRVNSKFAKISSRENISNSLFAKFSSRENKVLYSMLVRSIVGFAIAAGETILVYHDFQFGEFCLKPFARCVVIKTNTACVVCRPRKTRRAWEAWLLRCA